MDDDFTCITKLIIILHVKMPYFDWLILLLYHIAEWVTIFFNVTLSSRPIKIQFKRQWIEFTSSYWIQCLSFTFWLRFYYLTVKMPRLTMFSRGTNLLYHPLKIFWSYIGMTLASSSLSSLSEDIGFSHYTFSISK